MLIFCYNLKHKGIVNKMYCIENVERTNYPSDLVMDLTKLYCFKGKDFYYDALFKNDLQTMIKETIEKDTYYAGKLLKLNISENRYRLLISKNSQPKTNDERIVYNLKSVFKIIQDKGNELELRDNEFLSLAKKIFGGIKDVSYGSKAVEVRVNLLVENKKEYNRDKMKNLLNIYHRLLASEQVETTQLATNMYVDLANEKLYTDENEFMSLLIYYCLLCKERFNVFRFFSFFEEYYDQEEAFKSALTAASYDWGSGFTKTAVLNRLTINLMLKGYNQIEDKARAYGFDKGIKKIDSVESSILKLGEIFTKEEIRSKNPYLSDSTINRALDNLKKQNKIRPNGTGRSATWIRIVNTETFDPKNVQISLFDLIEDK